MHKDFQEIYEPVCKAFEEMSFNIIADEEFTIKFAGPHPWIISLVGEPTERSVFNLYVEFDQKIFLVRFIMDIFCLHAGSEKLTPSLQNLLSFIEMERDFVFSIPPVYQAEHEVMDRVNI
jgi:hypothetical protein